MSSGVQLSVVILEGQSHTSRLIVDSAIISVHLELRGNHSLFYQSEWGTVSTCSVPQWYFRSDFSLVAIYAEIGLEEKCAAYPCPFQTNLTFFKSQTSRFSQMQILSLNLIFLLAFSILMLLFGFWGLFVSLWRMIEIKRQHLLQGEANKKQHWSYPSKSGPLGLDMQQGIFCVMH